MYFHYKASPKPEIIAGARASVAQPERPQRQRSGFNATGDCNGPDQPHP
jgi:hypothetical protein